jgi:hypothetical protein
MKITGIVLAVKVEAKTDTYAERRKIDLEGIECSITDVHVPTPPARKEIEADIFVNTRPGKTGLYRVYELIDWKPFEPAED